MDIQLLFIYYIQWTTSCRSVCNLVHVSSPCIEVYTESCSCSHFTIRFCVVFCEDYLQRTSYQVLITRRLSPSRYLVSSNMEILMEYIYIFIGTFQVTGQYRPTGNFSADYINLSSPHVGTQPFLARYCSACLLRISEVPVPIHLLVHVNHLFKTIPVKNNGSGLDSNHEPSSSQHIPLTLS